MAPSYPAPRYSLIIEPFAGAAGYSTRHNPDACILNDAFAVIADLWSGLIASSSEDILCLPCPLPAGTVIADLRVPSWAESLIGFALHPGAQRPRRTVTGGWRGADYSSQHKMNTWSPALRDRVASQVPLIKHWESRCGTYREMPDVEATWFIDAPYQGSQGSCYAVAGIDYDDLADWCTSRRGQVIVCESTEATWLPFRPLGTFRGKPGKGRSGVTSESVWCND